LVGCVGRGPSWRCPPLGVKGGTPRSCQEAPSGAALAPPSVPAQAATGSISQPSRGVAPRGMHVAACGCLCGQAAACAPGVARAAPLAFCTKAGVEEATCHLERVLQAVPARCTTADRHRTTVADVRPTTAAAVQGEVLTSKQRGLGAPCCRCARAARVRGAGCSWLVWRWLWWDHAMTLPCGRSAPCDARGHGHVHDQRCCDTLQRRR
jgi:hypothetical protein